MRHWAIQNEEAENAAAERPETPLASFEETQAMINADKGAAKDSLQKSHAAPGWQTEDDFRRIKAFYGEGEEALARQRLFDADAKASARRRENLKKERALSQPAESPVPAYGLTKSQLQNLIKAIIPPVKKHFEEKISSLQQQLTALNSAVVKAPPAPVEMENLRRDQEKIWQQIRRQDCSLRFKGEWTENTTAKKFVAVTHNGGLFVATRGAFKSPSPDADPEFWMRVAGGESATLEQRLKALEAELDADDQDDDTDATDLESRIARLEERGGFLDRGVWNHMEAHSKGDAVTFDGALWICQRSIIHERPGDGGGSWRLAVKSGRAR